MPENVENIPETGPEAILYALQQLDADKIEAEGKRELADGKRTKRSGAVQKLRIASGLRRNNMSPADFMIEAVPVLPPKFRPFAVQGETLLMGDANVLYKDLMDVRDAHNEERAMFGDKLAGKSRLALYDAVKSVYGYGDAVKPKTKAKDVQGFLKKIVGKTSKFSWMSNKMIAKPVDNVGRSTIIVDPELDMDHIGLPKDLAFKMYAPYIQRRLKQLGMRDAEALKAVKDRTPYAEKALNDVVQERPVWYSRAPQWHRFSINAAFPKIIEAKAIAVPPAPCVGLGADFDGDQQIGAVVITVDLQAIKEILPDFYEKYKNCSLQIPSPTLECGLNNVSNNNMFIDTKTIASDGTAILAVDLGEFPHTELSNVRKDGEYDIEFYNVPDGVRVAAYDEETGDIVWAPVKNWSIHRGKQVEIVNLDDGSQIYTDDDPRAVYGIARDAGNLVPRRFTPTEAVKRGVLVPQDTTKLSRLVDNGPAVYFNFDTAGIQCDSSGALTVPVDFELGQAFGIMAGDGWCDKKSAGTFHIADNEGYNAGYMLDYIVRNGLIEGAYTSDTVFKKKEHTGRYGDSVRYSFNGNGRSVVARAISESVGGEGDDYTAGSGNKRWPVWFRSAGSGFIRGFVNGLVATDGSVSLSVKDGRDHDQLLVQVTSTSLRLLRETKEALGMIGVYSSITFSKATKAGNTAWVLNISTVDAKRERLLDNCCNTRKAGVFVNATVDASPTSVKGVYVPLPKCVSEVVHKGTVCYKIKAEYFSKHPEIGHDEREYRKKAATKVTSFYSSEKDGYITKAAADGIMQLVAKEDARREARRVAGLNVLDLVEADPDRMLTAEEADTVANAVLAMYAGMPGTSRESGKLTSRIRSKIGKKVGTATVEVIKAKLSERRAVAYAADPVLVQWRNMVYSDVNWRYITDVEKTGRVETGYDLTVPGHETFVNTYGIVLSNTINVHVPASDAAVKECREKLLPSSNPFKDRSSGQVMHLPKQEEILGLYTAATSPDNRVYNFASEADALHAIRSGKVPLSANVTINGKG